MVRRHLARDLDATTLALAHGLERRPRAHVRDVHVTAGHLGQQHVAGGHDRFGGSGNAPEPELRRARPFVRAAVALERLIFAVLDHRHAEHAGVLERAPRQKRRRDRMPIVGHGDASRRAQLGDVGQLLALLPARDRADRIDTRQVPASAAFRRISSVTPALSFTGLVLGMHATAVNPPATADAVPVATVSLCSCPGSRRCTCMSMKPGQMTTPAGTSTICTAVGERGRQITPDSRDPITVDQHVTDTVETSGGIDNAPALKQPLHVPLLPRAGRAPPCARRHRSRPDRESPRTGRRPPPMQSRRRGSSDRDA